MKSVKSNFQCNPNQIKRLSLYDHKSWIFPLIIAAQYIFRMFFLHHIMLEDSFTGDSNRIYDSEKISRNRKSNEKHNIKKLQNELTKMRANILSFENTSRQLIN